MRKEKKIFWLILISLFLLSHVFGAQVNISVAASSDVILVEEDYSTGEKATDASSSESIEVDQTATGSFQDNLKETFQGGGQVLQSSSASNSASFSRHIMCKDFDHVSYNPIDLTTIFRPSDVKAVCLTTVSIDDSVEFRWYYRSNSSRTWVSAYNFSESLGSGTYKREGHLLIAGYWPGYHYPRAYKVDVHLDGELAFSEFFEVTNGGLNSPRICEDFDADGDPVNMKSRFTIGNDTKVQHYLRFDKIAYFNEELEYCHNFTTVWIQPNGTTYQTHQSNFTDYKDTDDTRNYWEYNYTRDDYISISQNTPVGNWKVEVYLDRYYFNNTWTRYGPIATTPFIVGNETVADWTFMVYLDADNNLEEAGIDLFLEMAEVDSSSQVNIVVQMDRAHGYDDRYKDWTDCRRFKVSKNMTPEPGNMWLPWGGEVNMGDPDTLKDFVNWTISEYPANYYCLVLWNHGAGHVGLCFDSYTLMSTGDFLSLPELSQALSEIPAIIDVVLLDACAMSMTEVAYQIKDYANVLAGPEGLGYSPAPYDSYLQALTNDPSMSPKTFAKEVVNQYIDWCKLQSVDYITNATMAATDLTKITSLTAAIDDFALRLREKETPFLFKLLESHEQIIQARNRTDGYTGPYAGNTSCYIDLYHFAQLISQYVNDEELQNTADQVMTELKSIIIIAANKSHPNSHGLSIFFPDEKNKYDSFESPYEKTAFVEDSLWDKFVKYHLSGHVLTIETPYTDVLVKIVRKSNTTEAYGKIRVFVSPDSYNVTVTTPIYNITGPGSRAVFALWSDNDMSNPRSLLVNRTLTLEAEYETQYYVTIAQSGSAVTLNASIDMVSLELPASFWWTKSDVHNVSAPLTVSGGSDTQYSFTQWSDYVTDSSRIITVTGPITYAAYYKTQCKVTFSQSGVGTEFTGTVVNVDGTEYGVGNLPVSFWWDNDTTLSFAFQSSLVVTPNTKRYVLNSTFWNSTSGLSSLQNEFITVSMSGSVTANYKTQYFLTVRVDPTGLSPLPNMSPQGPWYDNGTLVDCTAQEISGRVFQHWTVDETRWDPGINPVTVIMDRPHEATAHYVQALSWWEALFRPEILQVILGLVGLALPITILGTTWVRTRRKRAVIKSLSNKIDEIYLRLKMNPQECEEELCGLRDTILEDVTDGKLTQESYDIMNKRIEKYIEELRKKGGSRRRQA